MGEVTGVVEWSGIDKFDNASIKVNGGYYNTKQEWYKGPPIDSLTGQTVSFDDGGKTYLKKLRVVPAGTPISAPFTPDPATDILPKKVGAVHLLTERCIIRQNSLTNAVNLLTELSLEPRDRKGLGVTEKTPVHEQVIALAKTFEAYSTGDADLEAAKKLMEDSGD